MLFEFENIYFKLDYNAKSKLQRKFEGVAAYQGDILGVENPEVTFIHQNGKWCFSGWKIRRNTYRNSPSKTVSYWAAAEAVQP